ncbi:MAG: magnesium transporter [Pirellulaceae bacterium]
MLEDAAPDQAAAVIDELPSDLQADLLGDLDKEDAEAILELMQPKEARMARELQAYADDVAGGLMVTELLRYPEAWTVTQVVADLQAGADEYRDYQIQYAYECDAQGGLLGVLRLRDLLLGDRQRVIRDIMIPNPLSVPDTMSLAELHGFFQQHHFLGVPVVAASGRLVGVVQRADVDQAWIEQQDRSFLRRQGIVSGEEIRSLPLWERSSSRLSWLSLNIVLNLLAAAIISHFESTLAAVIALTAFLPIISDMSGCSGNQAVAVSIRELMLGVVKPGDVFRVWLNEISVGIINGMAVGAILGCIAWVWKGNMVLGLVVGTALALNTMVAVSIGGIIPLVLRKFGRDPAVASGPLLTTVTDMCGFFLVLSLASAFIEQLK